MITLPAIVNPTAPAWRDHLESVFPRTTLLRPDQVATACGVDVVTIRRLFERSDFDHAPNLMGIALNAAGGARTTRRILRDSAVLFYARRANYTPEEFLAQIGGVLANRSAAELAQIQLRIAEQIKRKSA